MVILREVFHRVSFRVAPESTLITFANCVNYQADYGRQGVALLAALKAGRQTLFRQLKLLPIDDQARIIIELAKINSRQKPGADQIADILSLLGPKNGDLSLQAISALVKSISTRIPGVELHNQIDLVAAVAGAKHLPNVKTIELVFVVLDRPTPIIVGQALWKVMRSRNFVPGRKLDFLSSAIDLWAKKLPAHFAAEKDAIKALADDVLAREAHNIPAPAGGSALYVADPNRLSIAQMGQLLARIAKIAKADSTYLATLIIYNHLTFRPQEISHEDDPITNRVVTARVHKLDQLAALAHEVAGAMNWPVAERAPNYQSLKEEIVRLMGARTKPEAFKPTMAELTAAIESHKRHPANA